MTIESAGRRLAATVIDGHAGAAAAPAILFLHGLGSDRGGYVSRAPGVAESVGAVCMAFDLGGHGESDGDLDELSLRDHLADACSAYDALARSPGVDPDRIGVCGSSYGGYLAALLAGERPVARVFLRAPALYLDEALDVPGRDRNHPDTPPSRSAALENLATFGGETLVLESGRDEEIPRATIEAYVHAAHAVRHEVIEEATHRLTDPRWEATFVRLLVDWFGAL